MNLGSFFMENTVIQKIYSYFRNSSGICTDTRQVKGGELFFALRGERFNANRYVADAIKKGCQMAVIDDADYEIPGRTILCDDSLACLQELAAYHRKEMGCPVLAITGTNGKTTSKELIAAILDTTYSVLYTSGNLNNHIGVPLSVLRIKESTDIAVIEMGANHQGEIAALCKIADPDLGLITNVGKAHLEGFGSYEGVKKTKAELYRYIQDNGGKAFINLDNTELVKMLGEQTELISYGMHSACNCIARQANYNGFAGLSWEYQDAEHEATGDTASNLIGSYNFENIIAAVCVGNYFRVPAEKIDKAIREYTPSNQRSQVVTTDNNTLWLDMYNANPTSMALAIQDFSNMHTELKKTLIIGDMLELGEESRNAHKRILELIEINGIQDVHVLGEEFSAFSDEYPFYFYRTREDAHKALKENPPQNRYVLLKASRSIGLEYLLDIL